MEEGVEEEVEAVEEEVVLDEVVPQHEAEVLSQEVVRMVMLLTQMAHGLLLLLPSVLLHRYQRMRHSLAVKHLSSLRSRMINRMV